MQWNEEAIILSARKFGESGLLIEVFASTRGLYSGLVRGGQSKKHVSTFQPGNVIEATWRGRLEEQLGSFSAEVIDAVGSKVISEMLKLQSLISITSILRKTLPDRHSYPELYDCLREYLTRLTAPDENWLEQYVWMEIAILQYMGFGLDLSECAVTGKREGLKFISPRTGRAVTAEGAAGYQDRLFNLPKFLVEASPEINSEIAKALDITEYFINKNLFAPHERKIPAERGRLVEMLNKSFVKNAAAV